MLAIGQHHPGEKPLVDWLDGDRSTLEDAMFVLVGCKQSLNPLSQEHIADTGLSQKRRSSVGRQLQSSREVRVRRMGFAPVTCPTTPNLEALYYPNSRTIAAAARDLVEGAQTGWLPEERPGLDTVVFKGPF